MIVQLRILRFDPETDEMPRWETYKVSAEPRDNVLDALHSIKRSVDGSLTFRRSCAHGICGSDAMLINGRNQLACKVPLTRGQKNVITVAPLPALPVIKDLVVDMERFFRSSEGVLPYFIAGSSPTRERIQSPSQLLRYEDTTKCIMCAACTSSCPAVWAAPEYVGPAAIVNAHRFIFDSRDEGTSDRLDILGADDGVWRCRTIFNCVDACPRGIDVTKAILEVSSAIVARDC
jgi:succinate dehydrogenase / fumarate reductase, iron-sulfur subunit